MNLELRSTDVVKFGDEALRSDSTIKYHHLEDQKAKSEALHHQRSYCRVSRIKAFPPRVVYTQKELMMGCGGDCTENNHKVQGLDKN